MKIVAIIPAKGTSQRLENKNLHKISGRTLVERACEKLLRSRHISAVYLDTESDSIRQHCLHLAQQGLKFIMRPKELATNDTGANEMLIYALHAIEECDLVVQTFATSPLITTETIDDCIEKFLEDGNECDSFFSVVKQQEYYWDENSNAINFDVAELPNSFELPPYFMETHGLYGIYPQALLKYKARVGKKPLLIPIPKIESIDIDDFEDLEMARLLLQAQEA